jgi:hypothetical protein
VAIDRAGLWIAFFGIAIKQTFGTAEMGGERTLCG